jgi:hypothetical protein
MSDDLREPQQPDQWLELRDAYGKLCARLETRTFLLEVKRSKDDIYATFDLRLYLGDLDIGAPVRDD